MALALHPNRNKAVVADGAFEIVSEADRDKRKAHEPIPPRPKPDSFWTLCEKCNFHFEFLKFYLKQTIWCCNCWEPFMAIEVPNPLLNPQPGLTPDPQTPDTFWTSCKKCDMHLQFYNIYLNQTIRCHNCQESFLATQVPPPPLKALMSSKPWCFSQQQQGVSNAVTSKGTVHQMAPKSGGCGRGNSSQDQKGSFAGKRTFVRENRPKNVEMWRELRRMLVAKARMEIRKKLNELAPSSKSTSNGARKIKLL